jgi:type IV secretory pathway VirB9-like protein
MNEYNVECCSASSSYIILAQKKSISFVVLGKSKKINSLSLAHELDEHEHIKLLKNNSWTIVIITNKNKLIVANFSPTVIFSE